MKKLPFDLEKALAGERVITGNGQKVTQVHKFDAEEDYCVVAVTSGSILMYSVSGMYCSKPDNAEDLFMAPKTIMCNGFEVPAPESVAPSAGTRYFYPDPIDKSFCKSCGFNNYGFDERLLSRGLVYLNEEDALARAKAMLGIDPYK